MRNAWNAAKDFARRRPKTAIALGTLALYGVAQDITSAVQNRDYLMQLARENPKTTALIIAAGIGGAAIEFLVYRYFLRRSQPAATPVQGPT